MELHTIVMHQSAHEPAGRNPKPPVMERNEANHITRWFVRLPIVHRGNDPFQCPLVQDRTKKSARHRALRAASVTLHSGHALEAAMAKARTCEHRQELDGNNGGSCGNLKARAVGGRSEREKTKSPLP